jgi:hypothetical protein
VEVCGAVRCGRGRALVSMQDVYVRPVVGACEGAWVRADGRAGGKTGGRAWLCFALLCCTHCWTGLDSARSVCFTLLRFTRVVCRPAWVRDGAVPVAVAVAVTVTFNDLNRSSCASGADAEAAESTMSDTRDRWKGEGGWEGRKWTMVSDRGRGCWRGR